MGKRKRPFTSRKDPANLKRFRGIVQKFVGDSAESSLTTSFSDELFRGSERGSRAGRVSNLVRLRGVEPGKIKNRKTRRREERVLKKVKNSAFHQRKHVPSMEEYQKAKRTEAAERRKKKKAKSKQATELKERKEENKVIEEKIDVRKQGLLEANKKDERIMKQLEKQMKMKKRQNLPKSFMDDGLDYILDAIDSNKLYSSYGHSSDEEEDFPAEHPFKKERAAAEGDENSDEESEDEDNRMVLDEDSDSDEEQTESDLDESSSKNIAVVHSDKKSSRSILKSVDYKKTKAENLHKSVSFGIKKNVDELKSDDVGSDFSDSDSNDKSAVDSDSDSENEKVGEDEKNVHNAYQLKEDIYGRLRDAEGNIVTDTAQTTGAYVPPAKRLLLTGGDDSKRQQKLERLKKQLKGLVNRASEANIQPTSSQIEEIYRTNSRADVSESLCSIIMEACVTTAMTPDRLVMELAMLLAILHGNVGQEVGACFIQNLSRRFEAVQDGYLYGEGKEMDNIVSLFAHLYNFKVIHSQLVFDILKSFTESFGEKDIELILLLLKNVGFTLRKDDPSTLKDVIVAIQSKASSVDSSSFVDKSRVKFMLETIMAVRNNNMRKIPNYDPTHLEHLRKLIRGYVRGGKLLDNQLRISLADLLKAQESGRWWLVGSAWSGGLVDRQTDKQDETAIGRLNTILGTEAVSSSAILESARKQRMNTDTRKTIFCTIMASEDFVDAFEKLLRLGLKHKQERELVYVTVDCCSQQKHFNPFYAYLLQKFCEYDRRFQMTFQFHLWDKFSFFNQLSENNQKNLARLLTHLIANKAVSLSVLKTVEFGTLEKSMVRFLKQVLQGILLDYPDHVTVDVFTRIAPLTKLHLLREGLKLFMHHFLLKSKKAKEAEVDGVLSERVRLAEKALSSSGHGDTLL